MIRTRMAQSYSAAFRAKMVQRLAGPKAVPANQLAQEVGIHQSTLSRWLRDAQHRGMDTSNGTKQNPPAKDSAARKRSADDKMRLVFAAEALAVEDLGALLRREGVHDAELEAWRTAVKTAAVAALNGTTPNGAPPRSAERKRILELERELRRKDKALAEAAALLILEKNSRPSGGTGTTTRTRGAPDDPRADRRGRRGGRP
jgi:transposase-like protein